MKTYTLLFPEIEAREPGQPVGDLPAKEPAPLRAGVLRHDGPRHHAEAQKRVTGNKVIMHYRQRHRVLGSFLSCFVLVLACH